MKSKKTSTSIVPSFVDAEPIGEAYGGDGTGGGAYKIPTGKDWLTYDKFVCGMLPIELEYEESRPKNEILADIRLMRDEMREVFPGATDAECDAMRRESLFVKAGFIDGSAPGLARAYPAHEKLFLMHCQLEKREYFTRRREIL